MTPADPVRQNVEATLRRLFDTATAVPCGMVRAAWRLLGWDIDAGVPRLGNLEPGVASTPEPADGNPSTDVDRRELRLVGDRPGPAHLAIAGYEDLAASNIVSRLERLTPVELREIRAFEVANRGRRTVVGKIDQLLAKP